MSRLGRRGLAMLPALVAPARAQSRSTLRFQIAGQNAERTQAVVRARLRAMGLDAAEVRVAGDQLHVTLPPGTDAAALARLLVRPGALTIHATVDPASPEAALAVSRPDWRGARRLLLAAQPALAGDIVDTAIATADGRVPGARIDVKLRPDATEAFALFTAQAAGRAIAIALDERVLTAPVVREPIRDGRFAISGGFSLREAQEMAALMEAGPLPVPLLPPAAIP